MSEHDALIALASFFVWVLAAIAIKQTWSARRFNFDESDGFDCFLDYGCGAVPPVDEKRKAREAALRASIRAGS